MFLAGKIVILARKIRFPAKTDTFFDSSDSDYGGVYFMLAAGGQRQCDLLIHFASCYSMRQFDSEPNGQKVIVF